MAKRARRIVVKLGTNTLTGDLGRPDPEFVSAIADEIVKWRARGVEFIVVSSGAIGAGKAALGFKEKVREVKLRQACAAVGQARLMMTWDQAFAPHDVRVAQLLLTYHTFSSRVSFLNLKRATEALLELGVVPIVNENDTVSVEEIDASFGDNDRLSALVAANFQADELIILSDVAGLYTRPPDQPGAQLVPVVTELTPDVYKMAGSKPGSSVGRGGMTSKLDAAKMCTRAGIAMVVAKGREPGVLTRILEGETVGTRFLPVGQERGKERWLAVAQTRGRIDVDAGAAAALRAGRHLLPAGVVGIAGEFPAQSVVEIAHAGKVVAKAVTAFSSRDVERARGLKSADARRALGLDGAQSVNITRKKNLVLL